jgi:hypothetical protein
MPREVLFGPVDSGRAFTIAVIADVVGPGDLAAASTASVTLRRDPR